jgi:hypothetical protein
LAPVAEDALPVPSHLDLSQGARPSQLTPQQIAEREGAVYARNLQAAQDAPVPPSAPRPRGPSLRTRFPNGLPMEPVASHAPTAGGQTLAEQWAEQGAARAQQLAPDRPVPEFRGGGSQPDNILDLEPESADLARGDVMERIQDARLSRPRMDIGAEKVGRAEGMTTDEVRQAAGPVLDEAPGQASPILPEKALQNIIDKMRSLPKGGPEREAYVQAATSGKTKWQVENIRRTLEHLGLIVPAAAVSPDVRSMLLDQMRKGVTGSAQP